MSAIRAAVLAAFLAILSLAQSVTLPGLTNPNVSTSWLYYNKMRWAGAWNGSATYNPQDVVTASGYTYVSLSIGNLNNAPAPGGTIYWAQLPTATALWGSIGGTLSAQTDLVSAFAAKEPAITAGASSQYWRGDKSWQTLSTAVYGLLSASSPLLFSSGAFSCATCLVSGGSYTDPAWLTLTWAGGHISGIPSSFVNSFGPSGSPRTGVVLPASGDYSFAMLSGTASGAQLPATAVQANQANAYTTGFQDFGAATHTRPAVTGLAASKPATCAVGEVYFATDAVAGWNWLYCTATSTWTAQSVSGLPATVVQTNQSNAYTAGTQDFSAAAHTLPALVGTAASKPGTCTQGEMYFATDATAGLNWYYCTATNTWTAQSAPAASGLPSGSQVQYLQVEPNVGNSTTYHWNSLPWLSPADYNYSAITPTSPGTLTGGAGATTITLPLCPLGIYGAGAWGTVYLTAGASGTAEALTPGGGTCASAALGVAGGTIIVSPTQNHGSGYTVTSASAGIQEAALAQTNVRIMLSDANYLVYAPIVLPSGHPGIGSQAAGANITLQYNAGNGIVLNTATGSPTLSNFVIAPQSGSMTSGALIYNANNNFTIYLRELSVGVGGSRGCWTCIQTASALYARDIQMHTAYRGIAASNAVGLYNIAASSDVALASHNAGGACLYLSYQTGGIVSGLSCSLLDYGILLDTSSSPVNELRLTGIDLETFYTAGLAVSSANNPSFHTQLSNFHIQDDSNANNTGGAGISLSSSCTDWNISNGSIGYTNTGMILDGSFIVVTGVNLSNNITTGYGASQAAITYHGGTAPHNIDLHGNVIGVGRDHPTTPSQYGILIADTGAYSWSITGNTIAAGTNALAMGNSAVGPGFLVRSNTGIDDTWCVANSATSINVFSVQTCVPGWPNLLKVTGNTTITSLLHASSMAPVGRQITVVPSQSGLTVGGGGNIPVAHSLAQYQALTLTSDGTSWY